MYSHSFLFQSMHGFFSLYYHFFLVVLFFFCFFYSHSLLVMLHRILKYIFSGGFCFTRIIGITSSRQGLPYPEHNERYLYCHVDGPVRQAAKAKVAEKDAFAADLKAARAETVRFRKMVESRADMDENFTVRVEDEKRRFVCSVNGKRHFVCRNRKKRFVWKMKRGVLCKRKESFCLLVCVLVRVCCSVFFTLTLNLAHHHRNLARGDVWMCVCGCGCRCVPVLS